MKTLAFTLLVLLTFGFTSCVIIPDAPGPAGYAGNAYVSVSYDTYEPYSYWDNNPDVPNNPYFDEFYGTIPGVYEFEYYVNRNDYWYGTYEIWVNPGEPGRSNGRAGRNGLDTYLTLVCNADGPYEDRKSGEALKTSKLLTTTLADGSVQYTVTNADGGMKVTMRKTNNTERPSHTPKTYFKN